MSAKYRAEFDLVPLSGKCGRQVVTGERAAFEIAQEIADREQATVIVYRKGEAMPMGSRKPKDADG